MKFDPHEDDTSVIQLQLVPMIGIVLTLLAILVMAAKVRPPATPRDAGGAPTTGPVGNAKGPGSTGDAGPDVDLVLVLDATDSMAPYMEQAKARLRAGLGVVAGLAPNARVGALAYKDYGDDYGPTACRFTPLTQDHQAVRKFIDEIAAGGGGDIPEPIHEALAIATSAGQMGWDQRRKRVIILVGDSPCHSSGRAAAYDLAAAFAKDGGVINVIDTGGTGEPGPARTSLQPDLERIARDGGGAAFLLNDAPAFWRRLIVSAFGERYERDSSAIVEKFAGKEP